MPQQSNTVLTPRSLLFVPGDRPERFDKARQSGAHATILDLEDGVSIEKKDFARSVVTDYLTKSADCIVRINGVETECFKQDLAMLRRSPPLAIMLPKAEDMDAIEALATILGSSMPIIALIETAKGLTNCRTLLACPQVTRLAFGSVDFMLDLGIENDGLGLLSARSELVLASRIAGRPGPIDGVTVALEDEAALTASTVRARQMGFTGKLCIHPRQIDIVNTCFQPPQAEIEWARQILVAVEKNEQIGALRVDGKLVDRPIIERARRLMDQTGEAIPCRHSKQ